MRLRRTIAAGAVLGVLAPMLGLAQGAHARRVETPPQTCSAEPAMQGQVPATDPASDQGYCLNTELLAVDPIQPGTERGGMARLGDCAYVGSAPGTAEDGSAAGLAVVDVSDPTHPKTVQTLPGVAAGWDTTHVNAARRIVVSKVPTGFQVFSMRRNSCLLDPRGVLDFSLAGPTPVPGLATAGPGAMLGADAAHEFAVSPDGRTVVVSFSGIDSPLPVDADVVIVDIADLDQPATIATFSPIDESGVMGSAHDFDFSPSGDRLYIGMGGGDPRQGLDRHPIWSGVMVTDFSAIQARQPDGTVELLSVLENVGGHTVRYARIADHDYLITNYEIDCLNGVPAYAPAGVNIIDIADEHHPEVVSNFTLEVNATAENCMATQGDGISSWAHFSNVDNPIDAKLLFVSWTGSGLRVVNITDPRRPREVAYLNPVQNGATAYSYPIYDAPSREIVYADSSNGLVIARLLPAALTAPGRAMEVPRQRDPEQVRALQASAPGAVWYCLLQE